MDNAARAHVSLVTAQLRVCEPLLAQAVRQGDLRIVGAYYDLESGRVQILDADAPG